MALEIIRESPSLQDFTPLSTHQSQTPGSFFNGRPVLHYSNENARVVASQQELEQFPAFASVLGGGSINGNGSMANGHSEGQGAAEDGEDSILVIGVAVWVTSERFILHRGSKSAGISIPYPAISVHAILRGQHTWATEDPAADEGLYMQIETSSSDSEDPDQDNTITLTILLPTPPPMPPSATAPTDPATEEAQSSPTPIQTFYAAVTACSNLHPDPTDQRDQDEYGGEHDDMGEDMDGEGVERLQGSTAYEAGLLQPGVSGGGLPPAFPGSGGWITAENVGEYFDEEGNWIGRGGDLGPGAGVVRSRDHGDDDEGAGGMNDMGEGDGEESKWRRTG
ncbi:MAG: hypothetical protein M1827_000237 [Pycnora praestabilis]|nr:MAG: hypothetical protein M1827_000237 [Pycnora praestabilis]